MKDAIKESTMYLERITGQNLPFAVSVQEELFPGESGRANFEESMDESSGYEYFLHYENDACVGVIGIYSFLRIKIVPGSGGSV